MSQQVHDASRGRTSLHIVAFPLPPVHEVAFHIKAAVVGEAVPRAHAGPFVDRCVFPDVGWY